MKILDIVTAEIPCCAEIIKSFLYVIINIKKCAPTCRDWISILLASIVNNWNTILQLSKIFKFILLKYQWALVRDIYWSLINGMLTQLAAATAASGTSFGKTPVKFYSANNFFFVSRRCISKMILWVQSDGVTHKFMRVGHATGGELKGKTC